MEFEYFKEHQEIGEEIDEETHDDLELIIKIEMFGLEPELEPMESNDMMSEHYMFDEKYFVNEPERPEEIKEEGLAEMLKPKIP